MASNSSQRSKISLTNYILGGPLVSRKAAESKPKDGAETSKEPHYSVKKLDGGRFQLIDKRTGKKQTFKAKSGSKPTGSSEDGKVKVILRVKNKNAEIEIPSSGKAKKDESKGRTEEEKEPGKKDETKKGEKPSKPAAAEQEEAVKMPGQWQSGDWTAEQDATIRKLKAENKSWKDIAIEVGASKKDVQNRFKELQKSQEDGKKGDEKKKDNSPAEYSGLGALFDSEAAPFGEKEKKDKKDNRSSPEPEKKKKKDSQAQKKEEKSDKSSPTKTVPGGAGTAKQEMTAVDKAPKPDDIWTKDDCAVLEMLKERYENHKWQHMQAGFFNWTGRMVNASIIEEKFKDDGVAL